MVEPTAPLTPKQTPQQKKPLPSRLASLRQRFPSRGVMGLYLAAMGPGLISALAGNDAGGIGTYSAAGAQYGYRLLFLMVLLVPIVALVQEMAARMGAVTQRGLGELIRENFGVSWTMFALGIMFVANTATVVSEFAGVAAAGELFGISRYFSVPLAAFIMWLLVARGPFRVVERIFLAICLIQLTYVVAAFKGVAQLPPSEGWSRIIGETFHPSFTGDSGFVLLCIGVVGTTIAPWMTFFLQANMVDKGVRVSEYRYQKADVYLGSVVMCVIAWFVIVCTGATLHHAGIQVESTEDIAKALSVPLGPSGLYLFAAGLLAASLLAAAVLPLATAYTWCESFGWEIGLEKTTRQAPMFYGLFGASILIGAGVVLLPNVPLLQAILLSQTVNGILLPVVLVFMLKLVNNKRIMREYTNGPIGNIIAWSVVIALIALTVALLVTSFLPV
jgi:NRAMP (natural resistance-associated macrophage protein)-like metal ion transporter